MSRLVPGTDENGEWRQWVPLSKAEFDRCKTTGRRWFYFGGSNLVITKCSWFKRGVRGTTPSGTVEYFHPDLLHVKKATNR